MMQSKHHWHLSLTRKLLTPLALTLILLLIVSPIFFRLESVQADSEKVTNRKNQTPDQIPQEDNGTDLVFKIFLPFIMNGEPPALDFNKNTPANGSTGVSLSPVLSWNISVNATEYEYCFDTTNDSACSNWVSTGTNNYAGLWALQPATTYYWQIRAWNGPYGPTYANGSASSYWSFTTLVVFPGVFNKNAPANGGTGVSLTPVLSWNTSTNATSYEYCYDTSNDGTCSNWITTGTNTYVGLSGLQQSTTYYWQVRSWNGTYGPTYANGSPDAYWGFTTVIMNPGAFNKNTPIPGSTGVSLSPVLSWNPSTNATSYEYCYDTTYDGVCSTWVSTGTNTYVGLSGLQQGTTYYWQIRSWNGTYGPTYANGSPSAYWGFTTVIMNPGAFNKAAPANGATGVSLTPVLSWNASTNATRYEYCFDTTNDSACSNWISTGANTYAGLSGLQQGTTYFWQVRSWNGTYGPTYANGGASAYWGFTTVIMNPGAFNKAAPSNGSTGISLTPVLSWNASSNATKYEFCYDTSNDNACSNWVSTGTNTYVGLSGLQQGTTYYWQIRSWNGTYGPTYANGSASAYWSFTTIVMQPGAFNKTSPLNGYNSTTLSPVLSWTASTNATKYEYCYDTSNDGACSNWISTGINKYVGLSGLQADTTYYWQVRSWNGTYGPTYANGGANVYWSFKTLATGVWIMDNCTLYESASGSYVYFVCEIYNNTATGVEYFSIDVDLYDASGNLIGTDYGYVDLSIVHPQETACITVMFEKPPAFDHLIYYGSYYETTERRPSLSISNHSGSPDSYAYEILGIITNDSAGTVNWANAVASLYVNNGLVVGCDVGYINLDPPHLAPGQQSSFDVYSWSIPDPYAITRYKLQADGLASALNSRETMTGNKLSALGGGETMRLMDRSTLFQTRP